MSDRVKVSVVIPCFNHGQYIMDAIASVEACQEEFYEIIIINDGSTEPYTIQVMQGLEQTGYHVINQENLGLGAARNSGIKAAQGEYILPLDSDNKIKPDYIYKSIEILDKHPEVGVVYGDANYFGEKSGLWKVPEFNLQHLLVKNLIDACAVFRKAVWIDYKYDDTMPGYEDWDFWLGVAEAGWHFYHIPEVLFDYRVRSGSMVSVCQTPENYRALDEYVGKKHIGLLKAEYKRIVEKCDVAENELEQTRRFMERTFITYFYKLYKEMGNIYLKIKS